MLWRLALQCNKPHPDFLPPLSPQQLAEALAYYQLEPWGSERDHWHAALIATACLQPWSKRRLQVKDQLLNFGPKRDKPNKLAGKLHEMAMRLGAKIKAKQ